MSALPEELEGLNLVSPAYAAVIVWLPADSALALNGQEALWAFMERGDVLNLIQTVSVYLIRMGNGDPLRP